LRAALRTSSSKGLLKQCSVADAEPVKGGGPVCAGIIEKQVVISAYLRESGYELAHASF
jgi:hypothetical protein